MILPARSSTSSFRSCASSVAGEIAATPIRVRSGAYVFASCPAKSTAWPPCEWPHAANRGPAPAFSICAAARTESSTARPSLSPTRYGCGPRRSETRVVGRRRRRSRGP